MTTNSFKLEINQLLNNTTAKLDKNDLFTSEILNSTENKEFSISFEMVDLKIKQKTDLHKKETTLIFSHENQALMSIHLQENQGKESVVSFYVGDVYGQNSIDSNVAQKMFNRFGYKEYINATCEIKEKPLVVGLLDKNRLESPNINVFKFKK